MYLGRCYRKLGELKKAEKHISISLKKAPYDPDYNYEMALVYADMGKNGKALEYLEKSLEVWAEADPDYKPAQKAREKLTELSK